MYIDKKDFFECGYLQELTLKKASELIKSCTVTSEQLTSACLRQIEKLDRQGICLNAIIEVNPAALEEAKKYDKLREKGIICGPLHGIPILIKDNIATGYRMHTSAGALILADCFTVDDAPLVKKLMDAGAVIIGKTNMTEWAHFTSSEMPSGYSAKGGQTRNFYSENFEVGGSSSGSAVGITAGYGLAAIGTETSGSIIKPAVNSGLFALKPTPGFINSEGIIPIARSQDVPGPICKTAEDLRIMAEVLTENIRDVFISPEKSVRPRLGLLKEFFERVGSSHREIIMNSIEKIKEAGFDIIEIDNFIPYNALFGQADDSLEEEVLFFEFAEDLEDYLEKWALKPDAHTLEEIIEYNDKDPEKRIRFGQDVLKDALRAKHAGGRKSDVYKNARERDLRICRDNGLKKVIEENGLDAVIVPHYVGATIAARAGYPSVTVPAGLDEKAGFTALVLTGYPNSDFRLIELAEIAEKILDL